MQTNENKALELLISKLQVKRDLFPINGTKTTRIIRGVYVDTIILAKEILAEQSKPTEKVKSAEEFYESERILLNTLDITQNPEPDYSSSFYQNIFNLMEKYKNA